MQVERKSDVMRIPVRSIIIASFPGSPHMRTKNFRIASDRKLGGVWERGYYTEVPWLSKLNKTTKG